MKKAFILIIALVFTIVSHAQVKTAENTYELNYSILDSDSNEIENQTVTDLMFNPENGKFQSLDGEPFGEIHIQNSDNKIDFVIDVKSLSESDSPSSLVGSLNQKSEPMGILNVHRP